MAGERVFVIKIIGDTSQAEKAFKSLIAPLGNIDKAYKNLEKDAMHEMVTVDKENKVATQNAVKSASQWVTSIASIRTAYYMLKTGVWSAIGDLGRLDDTIVRTNIQLQRQGISARDLSKDMMKLGLNTDDLLKSVSGWEKAGEKGVGWLKELAVSTNQLSFITGQSTAELTESIGELSTKWDIHGKKIQGVMSAIAMLNTEYGVSSEALTRAASSSAVYARQSGIQLETILTLTGALERSAVASGMGSDAVKNLTDQIGDLTKLESGLRVVGINDIGQRLAKGDVQGAISEIDRGLQGLGKYGPGLTKQMTGFSDEMITGFHRAAARAGEVAKMQEEINKSMKDGKKLADTYNEVMGSLANQFKLLIMALNQLKMRVMMVLEPLLKPFVKLLVFFSHVLLKLPTPIFAVTAGLIGLVVIVVSLGVAFAQVVRIGKLMVSGFWDGLGLFKSMYTAVFRLVTIEGIRNLGLKKAISLKATDMMMDLKKILYVSLLTKAEQDSLKTSKGVLSFMQLRKVASIKDIFYLKLASLGVFGKASADAVATGALTAETSAQWGLNAAMAANPVGVIIVALIAFVAIMAAAWKMTNSTNATIRKLGYVLMFVMGPIAWLVAGIKLLIDYWDDFTSGFRDGIATVEESFGGLFEPLQEAWKMLKQTWDSLSAMFGVASQKGTFLKWLFNSLGYVVAHLVGGPLKLLSYMLSGLVDIATSFLMVVQKLVGWLKTAWDFWSKLFGGGDEGDEIVNVVEGQTKAIDSHTTAVHDAVAASNKVVEKHAEGINRLRTPVSHGLGSTYTGGIHQLRTPRVLGLESHLSGISPEASNALAGMATDARVSRETSAERAVTKQSTTKKTRSAPTPIILQLDGRILAQVMAEIENGEIVRFHNSPGRPGHGIPSFA